MSSPTWTDRPWICLDTETTGVDPATDRVVEVAAVRMVRGEVIEAPWARVNPGRPIPAEATAIHGITDAMVAQAPTMAELAPGLLAYLHEWFQAGAVLVGYNVTFDIELMTASCPGFAEVVQGVLVLDARPVIGHLAPLGRGRGRQSLGRVAERYGLLPRGDLHSALSDAVLAGDLLMYLRQDMPADLDGACAFVRRLREAQDADWQRYIGERRAQAEIDAVAREQLQMFGGM